MGTKGRVSWQNWYHRSRGYNNFFYNYNFVSFFLKNNEFQSTVSQLTKCFNSGFSSWMFDGIEKKKEFLEFLSVIYPGCTYLEMTLQLFMWVVITYRRFRAWSWLHLADWMHPFKKKRKRKKTNSVPLLNVIC